MTRSYPARTGRVEGGSAIYNTTLLRWLGHLYDAVAKVPQITKMKRKGLKTLRDKPRKNKDDKEDDKDDKKDDKR